MNTTLRLSALCALAALVLTAGAVFAAGVVNLNQASTEQLALLPRVGPSIAQRIVEFRESNGAFKSVEDLLLVRGIGEATFELIRPHVTVEGATTLSEKVSPPRAAEEPEG
jgi:competence protein ComEA